MISVSTSGYCSVSCRYIARGELRGNIPLHCNEAYEVDELDKAAKYHWTEKILVAGQDVRTKQN
jgi:hypothetical protein